MNAHPYGHEPHRLRGLRLRRLAYLLPIVAFLAWTGYLLETVRADESVAVLGTSHALAHDAPVPAAPALYVHVAPGSTAMVSEPEPAAHALEKGVVMPRTSNALPSGWHALLPLLVPIAGLAAGVVAVARWIRVTGYHEPNFGVFKGAMPAELVLAPRRGLRRRVIERVESLEEPQPMTILTP